MNKVYICDLDRRVNQGACLSLRSALKHVEEYIIQSIDPTFPVDEFRLWVDSDSEKPFRWNRTKYFWEN